ncbi:beta-ketoacyl synthase N-terminal-like domain-containing protein [Desulfoplanes sp.]
MRIGIEGMGVVGPFGTHVDDLQRVTRAVLAGSPEPWSGGTADTKPLADHLPARALRRVDHFTRMGLLAAFKAVENAGLSAENLHDTGIVLATGYGPSKLTFDFLDSIIDHGAPLSSPMAFSHSVHNIPAATIALNMHVNGPCSTVTQFETSVGAAFLTARSWLDEGRVERVLVGAVDEQTGLLQHTTDRIVAESDNSAPGRRRSTPLGEGAAFFCLHGDPGRAELGSVDHVAVTRGGPTGIARGPLFFSGAPGPFRRAASSTRDDVFDFTPVYGNIPIAMAFDIAIALLAHNNGLRPHISPSTRISCLSRHHSDTTGHLQVSPPEKSPCTN